MPEKDEKPKRNITQNQVSKSSEQAEVEVYSHSDFLLEIDRHLEALEEMIRANKNAKAGGVKLRFLKHIQQDRSWIRVQTNQSGANVDDMSERANPLLGGGRKSVMGYDIEERKPVTNKRLAPNRNEKLKFEDNVNGLLKAFPSLRDSDIIADLTKPGFDSLVRGVAKMVGIKDWEGAEMDVELWADIRESIRDRAMQGNDENEEEETEKENEFKSFSV